LPTGSLRVAWHASVGALLEDAPLVDANGGVVAVGTRGEVVAVAHDGSERWRISTGAAQPGPAALLSDDTVVFADQLGEAVAVRGGAVRWRTRFGRGDAKRPAPLPLDDGGVVVATAHDLAVLDVDGHPRARTTLPEAASGPLVAARGQVLATGSSGVVWAWSMGAAEPTRAGSFGADVDDGAAMADGRTMVAVVAGGARLVALDLVTGASSSRAFPGPGLWLGPPATHAGITYLMLLTPTAEVVVGVDAAGNETLRTRVSSRTQMLSADGGVAPLVPVPGAAPLVDGAGDVAFATSDGLVGTVSAGTVDTLDGLCGLGLGTTADGARVVGLAPLGPGAGGFVVACHNGALVAVRGAAAGETSPSHL
jgi:hypothetical protein